MSPIIVAFLLTAATPTFEARTADGQTIVGVPVELGPARLTLAGPGGRTPVDAARLLTVVSQQDPRRRPRPFRVVVELVDGSTIEAAQYVAREGLAEISLITGDDLLKVPLRAVRSVQFPRETDVLDAEWTRLTGGPADSDLLVVRVQETLDRHKGVLHEVTESAVRFDLEGEILAVKRSKIYGFTYRHSAAALPPAICAITDAAGSRWAAREVSLAGKLQWTTCAGLRVSAPLEDVAEIDFSRGKVAYLSDLKPVSSAWTPYFAGGKLLPEVARFYAPRLDRGFDSPELLLGGKPYRKGLALACRTEITYRLPEAFRRFDAVAGIDDAVRPGGRVRLVIRGDDKSLFDATLSGSEAPRAVELELTGVRRLTIVADFAGSLQPGSRLLLGNARITK